MNKPAGDIHQALVAAIDKSSQYERVQQLKAGSAIEEALFHLMGLARLSEGKQYMPNDRLAIDRNGGGRQDLRGNTNRVCTRLRQGSRLAEDWIVTSVKGGDLGQISDQVWQKLSKALSKVDPAAATDVVHDPRLRRKLAEAELKAKVGL